MGMLNTNTHKHRTSYFKSTLTFLGPGKLWKCLSAAQQNPEILAVLHNPRVRQHSLCRVGTHCSTHQYKLPVNFSTNPTSGGSLWRLTCIEHQIWSLPSLFWPQFHSGSQFWHPRQLAHHQLMSQQGPHFSPHDKAKANYKSTNLRKIGKLWYKWCSNCFSTLRENPSEEDDYDNYYY